MSSPVSAPKSPVAYPPPAPAAWAASMPTSAYVPPAAAPVSEPPRPAAQTLQGKFLFNPYI